MHVSDSCAYLAETARRSWDAVFYILCICRYLELCFIVCCNQSNALRASVVLRKIGKYGSFFYFGNLAAFYYSLYRLSEKILQIALFFYMAALFILCMAFTPWLIPELKPMFEFSHFAHYGPVFHVEFAVFYTAVPFAFYLLVKRMRLLRGPEQTQMLGFMIATLTGFIGGSLSFFPVYDIRIPQYGIFIMPIYPFVMAYFMMRYHLFDIEAIADAFQKEKLATIGLLAASVNHEIKNPLHALRGRVEVEIERWKEGSPDHDPLESFEKMLFQIDRITNVITTLNHFAKPCADQKGSQLPDALLAEAVKMVLDLVAYQFSLEKISVRNQIPENLPRVKIDQHELEQILFNLIVNACQAMPEGGEIAIRVEVCYCEPQRPACRTGRGVAISERRLLARRGMWRASRPVFGGPPRNDTGTVVLTILDTGTGIFHDQLKHLF